MQLLETGKTFDEIDTELKVKSRILYRRALRRMPEEELLRRFPQIALSIEQKEEQAFDQFTIEQAKVAGLSGAILKQVNKRIAVRQGQPPAKPRRLTEQNTIAFLEERLFLALDFMDEFALSGASAKDLAGVVDTLIENIQLLKGRPTSILSIEDRRKLNELIPAMIIEARRRGVPIDAEVKRIEGGNHVGQHADGAGAGV
jgi:hypothetical protein